MILITKINHYYFLNRIIIIIQALLMSIKFFIKSCADFVLLKFDTDILLHIKNILYNWKNFSERVGFIHIISKDMIRLTPKSIYAISFHKISRHNNAAFIVTSF